MENLREFEVCILKEDGQVDDEDEEEATLQAILTQVLFKK